MGAAMLCAGLGAVPLFDPDEGRNAEVAREMADSGSWLVPTFNGATYLDKPAFFFRLVAGSFKLFGENETAARLPSALSGVATLVVLFLFVRRAWGVRAGALAVLALATMPLYFTFSRLVIFDSMLTFFVVSALFCAYRAEDGDEGSRGFWHLAGALALGMATLVKGPVGFIVPTVVMGTFFLVERRRDALRRLFSPWNVLVWAAVVVPWFVAVSFRHPDFADYGLMHESLRRFTTTSFRRTEPFYYFVPVLLAGCLVWSMLFLAGARAAWRLRDRWSRADRFLMISSVVMIGFFSISQSKRPGYVLPVVVCLAALAARICDSAVANRDGTAAAVLRRAVVATGGFLLLVAGLLALDHARPGAIQHVLPGRSVERVMASLDSGRLALAFGSGATLLLVGGLIRRPTIACAGLVAFFPVVLSIGLGGVKQDFESMSTRSLARAIEARFPGTEVACLQSYPNGLAFYLRRTPVLFTENGKELRSNYVLYAHDHGAPMPDRLRPLTSVEDWIDARREPVLFLADTHQKEWLGRLAEARGTQTFELDEDWTGAAFEPRGAH